ncbi:MAG: MBL fold metallo-hydrolase [Acidobacteria bacterium]|nr:MBL fold metallo-hydrolase [Acidobacteriota bacterium]
MNVTNRARIHGWLIVTALAAVAIAHAAAANQPKVASTAQYVANASVLVTHGDTKVVFDPLFRNDFGQYRLVAPQTEQALFDGTAPFEGLDAVFVSHYHEDHFSAADVLRLLEARPALRLFAPAQAVAGMREISAARLAAVASRVHAIALAYRDAPVTLEQGALVVEAVRIPHSGWPSRQTDTENLAFRVTLDGATTVMHLGDADTTDAHFARDGAYWGRRRTNVAFPPYWFFMSDEGRRVLNTRLNAARSIGVHVPKDVPTRSEDRARELRGHELFTVPGEVREIR